MTFREPTEPRCSDDMTDEECAAAWADYERACYDWDMKCEELEEQRREERDE